MTAGQGIVREEFKSLDFTKEGGVLEICQVWVNLQYRGGLNLWMLWMGIYRGFL